ncbi:hypothetical protein ACIGG8_42695, partial [Kitasatospora sp. NPDC085464]
GDGSTRLVLLHEPGRPRGEFVTVHPTGKDTAVTGKDTAATDKDVHPAATDTPDPHPVTHEDGTHLLDAGDDRIPGAPMPLVRNPRDEALPHDPSAPTARQDMVPGARDLEMVEHLRRDVVVPGDRPREWGAQDHALYDHLTATDARRPFGFWKGLSEDQAAALVLAERKGLEFAAREHAVLKDRLRQATGSWSWAQNYPRDSEQALDRLIATVQDHMRTGMFVATNFFLDKPLNDNRRTTLGTSGGTRTARSSRPEPEPAPKTVLDLMIEDPSQTFKNVWQTRASQAAVDDSRRGGVEEHFGYAATLRRDPATRNHFQDTGTDKSAFHPDEKEAARLPKYAALVSELQPRGVAVRYGSAIMRWKDDVRARATHTPKDSWSAGAMGARSVTPDSHLLPLLTYGTDFMVRRVFGEATGFRHDVEFGRRLLREGMETDEYFETQIHGDLHWKDLHSVTIVHLPEGRTADRTTGPLPTAEAAQQLRDRLLAHRQDRGYDFTVELRLHGQPPVLDRVVPHPSVPEPPVHETAPTILDNGDEITPVEHDATQHGVTQHDVAEHDDEPTPPPTGAPMRLADHPLDVPRRMPGPGVEDPFPAGWGQLSDLRARLDALPADSPERAPLQRQVDRAQAKLRSDFTTFLDHDGSDLATASRAREDRITELRTQTPPPGAREEAHHQRLLDTLELEVRELQAELDRHALDARSKQRMIPGPRDLALVAHLQDPQKHPLPEGEHAPELLERLTGATVDWKSLDPVQAAALVMVERKAMAFEQRDRALLTEKLTAATGEWAWAANYPRDTPGAVDELIDRVQQHMRTGMFIATNFHFDQPLNANRRTAFGKAGGMLGTWGPKPKTLLDKLMADKQGLFRNAWETGASQAAVVPSRRGGVEEHMGYGPALRRSHDTRGLFQDTGTEDSVFAPKKVDRGLMPKYGALVSELQPFGVAQRYGAFALHWSDDIRGRVTHTPNDSWTAREKGALSVTSDSHLLPLLLWGERDMVERVFGEATGFRYDPTFGERMLTKGMDTNSYFETQIHGPLSWGDLRHVVISHREDAGTPPSRRDAHLPTRERAEEIAGKLRAFATKNGHAFTVELRRSDAPPVLNRLADALAPTPQQPRQPQPLRQPHPQQPPHEDVPSIIDSGAYDHWSDSDSDSDAGSAAASDTGGAVHPGDDPAGTWYGEQPELPQGFLLNGPTLDVFAHRNVEVDYPVGLAGQEFVPGPEEPHLLAAPWELDGFPGWDASATGFDRDLIFADLDENPVLWRGDTSLLYRWENGARDYLEVFAQGFAPRGEDTYVPLETYLVDNPASVFVSTTRSAFHQSPGWGTAYRYLIDAPGGIDVRATLPHRQLADIEQEVAFPGGIRPEFVVGVEIVHDTALLHDPQDPGVHWYEHPVTFVPNPGYQPAHRFAHEEQHEQHWDQHHHDSDDDGGVGNLGLTLTNATIHDTVHDNGTVHDDHTDGHRPSADGGLVT